MAIAGYNSKFYVTTYPSVGFTNITLTDTGDHKTYTISDQTKRYLDKDVPVVIQKSTDGGTTWPVLSSGFTLSRVNARIIFSTTQTALFRIASANYLPVSQFGDAAQVEYAGKIDTEDVTRFNTTGAKSFIPTLAMGMLKCMSYWTNTARVQALLDRSLLVVSFQLVSGNYYEGYCYTTDSTLKAGVKGAVDEDLTFQLTDSFFSA